MLAGISAYCCYLVIISGLFFVSYESLLPQLWPTQVVYSQPAWYFLCWSICGLLPLLDGVTRGRIAAASVFLLTTSALYLAPGSSRRHFLTNLYQVKPGMTASQVTDVMVRFRVSPYHRPEDFVRGTGSIGYIHSTAPEYNGDLGLVTFKKGRVIGVRFLQD
jgi:hypothetical protein